MGGISADEAAEIFGISRAGVHRAVFDGRLLKALKAAKRGLDRETIEYISLKRINGATPCHTPTGSAPWR